MSLHHATKKAIAKRHENGESAYQIAEALGKSLEDVQTYVGELNAANTTTEESNVSEVIISGAPGSTKALNEAIEALPNGTVEQIMEASGCDVARVTKALAKKGIANEVETIAEQEKKDKAAKAAAEDAKKQARNAELARRADRDEQIKTLKGEGKTTKEIAEAVGLSTARTQQLIGKLGLSGGDRHSNEARDKAIFEAIVTDGQKVEAVAEEHGLSVARTRQIVWALGGTGRVERLGGNAPKVGSDEMARLVEEVRELEGRWSISVATIAAAVRAQKHADAAPAADETEAPAETEAPVEPVADAEEVTA